MILMFADCVLNIEQQSLTRGGQRVAVEPQVFELIRLLAENAGRLVVRDEVVEVVWGGRIVSESAISTRIAAARKAVGDTGRRQAVIRTVQKRGLQMAVPVVAGTSAASARSQTSVTVQYASADDGAMLAYAVDGSGPPVMAVGNFYTDVEMEMHVDGLRELHNAIKGQNTLLRFDQRGAGLSHRTLKNAGIDESAEDMLAVLDSAGLGRTAIYARSGGALTALTFAARYPERLTRMVIVAGYVDGRVRRAGKLNPDSDPIRGMYEEGWEDPQGVLLTASMKAYLPEGPDDFTHGLAAYFQANTSRENILAHRDAINLASVADCLPRIACPVLVIHARHDRIHPLSEAQKMASGIKKAELLVLESANHLPLPGHPSWEIYLRATLDFLRD